MYAHLHMLIAAYDVLVLVWMKEWDCFCLCSEDLEIPKPEHLKRLLMKLWDPQCFPSRRSSFSFLSFFKVKGVRQHIGRGQEKCQYWEGEGDMKMTANPQTLQLFSWVRPLRPLKQLRDVQSCFKHQLPCSGVILFVSRVLSIIVYSASLAST